MSGAERKMEILNFITTCLDEQGYSPTYREIGANVGLRSTSSVARYIEQLKDEGKLTGTENGKFRTISGARQISISADDAENARRVHLAVAEGGYISFDCVVQKSEHSGIRVFFSGILDATQLKKPIGRVIHCAADIE